MAVPGHSVKRSAAAVVALALSLFLGAAQAQTAGNPIVRVSTTFGDFSVELFADETPATVENFLNYLERGDYQNTFLHRLEQDFVLQGGGYRFQPCVEGGPRPCGPLAIPQDPPVVNEPGLSNVRGTIAMAKMGGDPDSATSQWFVNLADNAENLDEQNGGFTVFGQVLGEGMQVVDRLAEVDTFNLGGFATSIPLRDFTPSPSSNRYNYPVDAQLIKINPLRVQRYSEAMHVYEFATERLIMTVDAGEELGLFSLTLHPVANDPDIIFELNPNSLISLGLGVNDDMATFSAENGRLHIPRVELNEFGSVSVITDVEFRLIEQPADGRMRFVLESYQES